jgi:hypothetical protein
MIGRIGGEGHGGRQIEYLLDCSLAEYMDDIY